MLRIGSKGGYVDTPKDFYRDLRGELSYLEWATAGTFDRGEFDLCDIPVRFVHAGHYNNSGFNPVDASRRVKDLAILDQAILAAECFGTEEIIIHPQRCLSGAHTIDNLIDFINIPRRQHILLENMPCPTFFATEPMEIQRVMAATGCGFCLDIAHAACYAYSEGYDLEKFLRDLIALEPTLYHLSDTPHVLKPYGWCEDEHWHLGTGDIDWELAISLVPDDSCVTLETPMSTEGQLEDIRFLRNLEEKIRR
jgi:sugar phosphate isomerase/epimerase